jgi:hypothetical protein
MAPDCSSLASSYSSSEAEPVIILQRTELPESSILRGTTGLEALRDTYCYSNPREMFRDSDFRATNPHKVTQQVPSLQAVSNAARFQGESVSASSSRETYIPEPIPTTWDTIVDPTHRDADWAGLVAKENHRRRTTEHRALNSQLMQSSGGIVSIADNQDVHKKQFCKVDSNPGVVFPTEPVPNDHWKTSQQRMNDQEITEKHRLSQPRRPLSKISQYDASENKPIIPASSCQQTSIGSLRCSGRNGSMLTNIGRSIATKIPTEES